MDNELKILKEVEAGLYAKLQANPIFIQLESLRKTIATFENGSIQQPAILTMPETEIKKTKTTIPAVYDPEQLTWKERVIYIVNSLNKPGVAEVLKEMQKLEPSVDKKFMTKRVSVTITQLKADGKLSVERVNKKGKYSVI